MAENGLIRIDQDSTWIALKDATMQDLVRTIPADKLQLEVEKVALQELVNQAQGSAQVLLYAISGYPNQETFRTKAAKTSRLCKLLAAVLDNALSQPVTPGEDD